MVKVRMNTADVAAEVKCLRRLIGMRCSNVYDLSPKTYIFKLMNSSGVTESGESEKVLLLMESGVRLHTTAYMRDKSTTPSGFTLKLRKHIRTRRLEDVRQLGYDRIILFQFGLGSNAHYVILELYANGNIILTDSELMVMTLLRSHRDDDKGFAIMSRHPYPIDACRVFERTTMSKLQSALDTSVASEKNNSLEDDKSSHNASNRSKEKDTGKSKQPSDPKKKSYASTNSKKHSLKAVLGEGLGYGPALSEHIILDAGLLPNMVILNEACKIEGDTIQVLAEAITRFEDWLVNVMSGEKVPEGYILMQKIGSEGKESLPASEGTSNKVYDEFCPILLNQFKSREHIKFETFDAALDEFYSKIESQRAEKQKQAKEEVAVQKLNKIRLDQENRVHSLKDEVDRCITMAELIEYNLEDVDAAILAVRVALANGMDWEDLARMVKEEKKAGNPVAGLIDKLHLERNFITLLLSNNLDEMDDDEKTRPADKVEVDLALSAHANARRWYEMKKRQESKQEKTVTAHEKAFKAAERKTRLQLAQEKTVAAITHMRKVHWFEKFNWFISSENYLVISGRDAQQNEMIVKRYMSKGDLYIHADLHGASSTVIKNHNPDNPVPPLTLNQAGCFTVCHSQAWDSKIVTSAWWVYPHQVSKTAPTGEYLTVGSFMIRGKKNFLPPHPLVMGFGLLFRLDETSLGSHLNERRVRGEEESSPISEVNEPTHEQVDCDSDDELTAGIRNNSVESEGPHDPTRDTYCTSNDIKNDSSSENVQTHLEDLIDQALGLGSAKVPLKNRGSDTQIPLVEDPELVGKKTVVRDKPFISKAERRKLKKGHKSTDDVASGDHEREASREDERPEMCSHKSSDNPKQAAAGVGKTSRGQKGKLKKIKQKYAEQDEEERKIRMALLASAGKSSLNSEKESENSREPPSKVDGLITDMNESSKICYRCKKVGHLSRDCQENLLNIDGNASAGPQAQVNKDISDNHLEAGTGYSDEMDRIALEEDDINEIGEEEKGKLNDIDYLTGNPLLNDILHYAIPVCGPYNALQSYKYHVKVTPGTAKKGKAAKTAMNLFSHMPEATTREKELMKASKTKTKERKEERQTGNLAR
ncbi:hypothetical protein H6P81_002247 [Aristolochia fimbriata]|uniref:CCHC-type domain-containing protein n=1 Tax=Aristolochia fimbriata TaxID=158543 RepID=A0AAV7F9T5_ARIFI|nr:hypothetical protein H6P81_002247 [Aristolochia fimbriata]